MAPMSRKRLVCGSLRLRRSRSTEYRSITKSFQLLSGIGILAVFSHKSICQMYT